MEEFQFDNEIIFNILKDPNAKKLDEKNKFFLKAIGVVLDKYGGEFTDWFCFFDGENISKDEEYSKYKINFLKINNWGLINIKIYCKYDELKNDRVITHYKSIIPFRTILSIIITDEKITISQNKTTTIALNDNFYSGFKIIDNINIKYKSFHKELISKYEEFCEQYYNINHFSKADEIKKFKELLDNGTITQEEFDSFKKNLLNN